MNLLDLPPTRTLPGTKRTHRMGDDEDHVEQQQPEETNMAKEQVTDRSRVLAFIAAKPGIFPAVMSKELSIAVDTLYQHLSVLRRRGEIVAADGGGWRKATAGDEGAGDVKPPKGKPRKRKAAAQRATKEPARVVETAAAKFIIDDAGCVAISCGTISIDLNAGESTRLHTLLDRTKTWRK